MAETKHGKLESVELDLKYRRALGKTGLDLTVLGLGSGQLGGFQPSGESDPWLESSPEDEALATVQSAFSSGITYFDTAPYYGYGRAEHRLGQVLRQASREKFVLSTKIGRVLSPLRPETPQPSDYRYGGLPFVPAFDYSYEGTMRSIEDSYQRLGLASIDIAFIHDVDLFTHKEPDVVERYFRESMEGAYVALDELRSAGIIRAIGCGLNDATSCSRFLRAGNFDCMMLQGRYTLLNQCALDEMLPICKAQGASVLIAAPFNSGILAMGPVKAARYDYSDASAEILDKVRSIESVCQRYDIALAAAALQFPLGHECVTSVVPGSKNPSELEANINHMFTPIPDDLWAELQQEGLLSDGAPLPRKI